MRSIRPATEAGTDAVAEVPELLDLGRGYH